MNSVVDVAERDMEVRPDLNTACIVPWVKDPTAQIIYDCYFRDGRLHDLAPHSVLKRVIGLYDELGLKLIVAPELEFFW